MDIGEMFQDKGQGLVRDVQVHAVKAVLFHLEVNGPRHDVARCEFGTRIMRGHETRAAFGFGQKEFSAFSAHGLSDQK